MTKNPKNFRQLFLISVAVLSGIVSCLSNWQTANSQTKPLTYPEIVTALNSKLPNNAFKNKAQVISWLIAQIKARRVDKPFNETREDDLRQAGATDELIAVIRQNSPSLPIATPAPTPASFKTIKNSIGMEFVLIPAGSFMMGSPKTDSDRWNDEIQHQVTISNSFYLGKTEITQEQWEKVMGSKPDYVRNCPRCPVDYTTWDAAQDFIRRLNARGEGTYRLPTEAEWEYAARAGSTTKYPYGSDEKSVNDYEWHQLNSGYSVQDVGRRQPNKWGLNDMLGNAQEWCADWYGIYSSIPETDPTGPSAGSGHVIRGGSYDFLPKIMRAARRFNDATAAIVRGGFRLVRVN